MQAQYYTLRGQNVVGFEVCNKEMICLPQIYDLFLKKYVSGLHTVYTKLKRLSIKPLNCDVQQVRALRNLGAIQLGVNRCKLIEKKDFEKLYTDCVARNGRPGRPTRKRNSKERSNDKSDDSPLRTQGSRCDSHLSCQQASSSDDSSSIMNLPPMFSNFFMQQVITAAVLASRTLEKHSVTEDSMSSSKSDLKDKTMASKESNNGSSNSEWSGEKNSPQSSNSPYDSSSSGNGQNSGQQSFNSTTIGSERESSASTDLSQQSAEIQNIVGKFSNLVDSLDKRFREQSDKIMALTAAVNKLQNYQEHRETELLHVIDAQKHRIGQYQRHRVIHKYRQAATRYRESESFGTDGDLEQDVDTGADADAEADASSFVNMDTS